MSTHHLDSKLLHRLLLGGLDEEEGRAFLLHHLEGCPDCMNELRNAFGVETLDAFAALENPWNDLELLRERDEAAARVAGLVPLPYSERLRRLESEAGYLSYGVAEALIQQSRACLARHPGEAREWASLALGVAEALPGDDYADEQRADLAGRAWGHQGEAWRRLEDLPAARQASGIAAEELARGTGCGDLEAEWRTFLALLYLDQGQHATALFLAQRVVVLGRSLGDPHIAGCGRLVEAAAYRLGGEMARALDHLEQAQVSLDPERDPGLAYESRWLRLNLLAEAGHLSDARKELERWRSRPLEAPEATRLDWLEARWWASQGAVDRAAGALADLRETFAQAGLERSATLVCLDLAILRTRSQPDLAFFLFMEAALDHQEPAGRLGG